MLSGSFPLKVSHLDEQLAAHSSEAATNSARQMTPAAPNGELFQSR